MLHFYPRFQAQLHSKLYDENLSMHITIWGNFLVKYNAMEVKNHSLAWRTTPRLVWLFHAAAACAVWIKGSIVLHTIQNIFTLLSHVSWWKNKTKANLKTKGAQTSPELLLYNFQATPELLPSCPPRFFLGTPMQLKAMISNSAQ